MSRYLLSIDDLPTPALLALTAGLQGSERSLRKPRGTLGMLFQQASVRTMASFSTAGVRLGLTPMSITTTGNALRDQCDLEDEVCQLGLISTCVVVRRASALNADRIRRCTAPVVNAGDGSNEHPSQALLDIATMRHFGLDGKHVVLMGNLRDHRVHHSLAKALQKLGVSITLLSPPGFAMASVFLAGHVPSVETDDALEIDEVLSRADFVYLTPVTYWNVLDSPYQKLFSLDLARVQAVLKRTAKILHPFPRMGELANDIDASPYDAYHYQTSQGPSIRSHLLRWLIDDELPQAQ